jgi:hypothetical protein
MTGGCGSWSRSASANGAAAGASCPHMHIDQYRFGTLVVDGREIRGDVLVTPRGVQKHWWRREGHVLRLEDLGTLQDENVRRLVVGTGAYGGMRPAPGLERELAEHGVAVEVLPTADAVDRINALLRAGATGWAGALHLTC